MSRRIERKALRRERKAQRKGTKRDRVATGRQIRFGRAFGLLVCAAGFAAMGLGWFGAARVSCVDCQIPYLLSGGAVGLGLVIFGVTILVLAQLRAEGRRTADHLARMDARLAEAVEAVAATHAVAAEPPFEALLPGRPSDADVAGQLASEPLAPSEPSLPREPSEPAEPGVP